MMNQRAQATHAADEEGELLGRARSGDGEAFRAIMQACNQPLFRIARSVLRDDTEAEDVLQETYLRAFRNLGEFRGESSILTWLSRIALNEARGRLRRRRPTVELDAVEAAQQQGSRILMFPTASSDPERSASLAEARRLLEHAVDDLPESFRLVFILREIEERSIEETAALLAIRSETVKTRLHRARRLLRRMLDRKLVSAVSEAYPFLGRRCERLTQAVLARLEAAHLP
ncbi:MAG: RNA polymerase sigma factor [Rhodospirillaceae bacterium]|nr:RNA polymerase sigma factor [Rhodospirillaceae bacterium]